MSKDWVILIILILLLFGGAKKGGTTNLETWGWTDYKGRKYEINVHREVH